MVLNLILAILAYALVLYIIASLRMPEPGPRVANIVVSIIFAVHLLNVFGVIHILGR